MAKSMAAGVFVYAADADGDFNLFLYRGSVNMMPALNAGPGVYTGKMRRK